MADEPHVVILGGGFAGVGVIKKLKKARVKVTLIDKNDYHTFLPLLYQVATDELAPTVVGFPLPEMLDELSDGEFQKANVTGIDLANKKVTTEGSEPTSYDYLVVGLGAVVNYFGTKGAAENAFHLYNMHDAVRLKEHVLERLEAADKDPAQADDGALTFCVVGGGATGVEIAGALSELLHEELKEDYPNLPVEQAEVHLYEMGPCLLGPFKPKLQEYAKQALEERAAGLGADHEAGRDGETAPGQLPETGSLAPGTRRVAGSYLLETEDAAVHACRFPPRRGDPP